MTTKIVFGCRIYNIMRKLIR